jgi:hypothetical protein
LPWDTLSSWWIIGLLVVLSLIEFFADKAPAVNHISDIIQTFIRPTAGATFLLPAWEPSAKSILYWLWRPGCWWRAAFAVKR